ncbi:MAG: FkbM family methyltransferase [Saprospiraceae bacterium]|nr:FkbM family methyltransferase [Saprospiraceae bacterium]
MNIEPNPEGFNEFIRVRKRDINLNIGVSSQKSELLYYFMSNNTLNTFSEVEAQQYVQQGIAQIQARQTIKVDTIENILQKYFDGKFPDLLSLVVEGLDEEILKSINFDKHFPKIICVETFNFGTQTISSSLISFLESKEYKMIAFTGINSIFLRKELYPYK